MEDQQQPSILIPKINMSESITPVSQETNQNNGDIVADPVKSKKEKMRKIMRGFLIFVILFVAYFAIAGFLVYKSGTALAGSLKNLSATAQTQDFTKIRSGITDTKKKLSGFESSYRLISWTGIFPFIGPYVNDVSHLVKAGKSGLEVGEAVLATAEPYSDLLGLKGTNVPTSGEKTAQDRIDFIVKSIPDLLPKIDQISGKVKIVQEELAQINADRYPEKFKGKEVRANIKKAQELINETATFVVNGKPVLEAAPYLLGIDSSRKYFILFQNDKEIRPTGGFMTAYATMSVDKAHFSPTGSDDIYNLDAKYKSTVQAPDPLIKYIKGPYILSKNLRLRDMNWSPDFAESMKLFTSSAKEVSADNVDGIIAVDTQLLVNLLNAIGPIGVPGFGNFSTAIDPQCNCPQVIHELESFADVEGPIIWDPLTGKIILRPKNSDNRKRIIGPLMNSILANAMAQPKEKLPGLFEAVFKSLTEKHVLFYMFDEKTQEALGDFGLTGSIKDYSGDYLHINDANLGGRKSNLYATEEVAQDIKIKNGEVTKTVTITYKNPQSQDGWLNSVLPTWVRMYVPKGSTLITAEGLEAKQEPYEDLGKTVFAGFFQLRPEGVAKVTFQYKLPFKVSKEYKLLIQKQPGTDGFLYTVKLGKHQDEFYLKTDKELKIGL